MSLHLNFYEGVCTAEFLKILNSIEDVFTPELFKVLNLNEDVCTLMISKSLDMLVLIWRKKIIKFVYMLLKKQFLAKHRIL